MDLLKFLIANTRPSRTMHTQERTLHGDINPSPILNDYADPGNGNAGIQEPATDYPFDKPGFAICHVGRYLAFQSCNISLCRQLW